MLVAFQTAAKATRDALFLSNWDITALPVMVIAASFASLALAYTFSWLMPVIGPQRLIPGALVLSAVMLLVEWGLLGSAPAQASVIVYLHYAGLGALLISGFWSIVSERFDPRSAKRYVGRVAAGGTVGGVLGGLMAERVGALLSVAAMLPLLSALHLLAALLIMGSPLRRGRPRRQAEDDESAESSEGSGFRTINRTPYLRNLVLVVFLVTVSEMLIDYVFKARASAAFDGAGLLRFFALFYTGVSVVTVILQASGARWVLQKLGLAQTVALMPGVSVIGSGLAIAVPGLPTAGIARGGEIVLRNSWYRAGYELLFSPVHPREKRATKSLVDVGVVRVGDIAGGLLVQGILVLGALALSTMLAAAMIFSMVAIYVSRRLHRGYVKTLEKSLIQQGRSLDELDDAATRTAILQTVGMIDVRDLFGQSELEEPGDSVAEAPARRPSSPSMATLDHDIQRLTAIRSRDVTEVQEALAQGPLELVHVPQAIALLAWNDVAVEAIRALRRVAGRNVGQLVDHLLDPDEEFAIRRRLPLILAMSPSDRTVDGLLRGLGDSRFEVRYRCGRALSHIAKTEPSLTVQRERVITAVLGEVAVDDGVWRSRRLLDQMDDEDWSPVMDELLINRFDRSLEHVFTLLSLIMPREPLKIAFKGLHTDDKMLRGTALEYLETALPPEIKMAVWPFLEDDRRRSSGQKATKDVLDALLQSNQSIVVNLKELRRSSKAEPAPEDE